MVITKCKFRSYWTKLGNGLTMHAPGISTKWQHTLLQYGANPDDTTGKLIQIGLKTVRMEIGIDGQLFAQDWKTLHYLVTLTWLSHTWQFQSENGIRVENNIPDTPLS